jgi:hypothetical protein
MGLLSEKAATNKTLLVDQKKNKALLDGLVYCLLYFFVGKFTEEIPNTFPFAY